MKNTFEKEGWSKELTSSESWRRRFEIDERLFWQDVFIGVEMGNIRSWAYQWQACIWLNSGYSITPCVNLVSNIGFTEEGTNTIDDSSSLANMETGDLGIINEPRELVVRKSADRHVFEYVYLGGIDPRVWIIRRMIKRLVKYMLRTVGSGRAWRGRE